MAALKPVTMGLVMGPMLLWMFHNAMVGSGMSLWALFVFVGMHVVLILAALSAAVFATRFSPRMTAFLARLHRPSLHHISVMLLSAMAPAATVHLFIHGIA